MAKMKRLLFFFSCLYSRVKIFVFAVNNRRHFCSFRDLYKDYKKRTKNQRYSLPFAANFILKLSIVCPQVNHSFVGLKNFGRGLKVTCALLHTRRHTLLREVDCITLQRLAKDILALLLDKIAYKCL